MNEFVIHSKISAVLNHLKGMTSHMESLNKSDEKIKTVTAELSDFHEKLKPSLNQVEGSVKTLSELVSTLDDLKSTEKRFNTLIKRGWFLFGAIAIATASVLFCTSRAHAVDYVLVANSTTTPANVTITQSNPIPISGSFSASTVNITTATANTALPVAGVEIGGVSPDGHFQAISVDVSSAIKISGTINSTSVSLSTSQFNAAYPGNGTAGSYVGPTGLTQAARVTVSSDIWVNAMIVPSSNTVTISTGGVSAFITGGSIGNTSFAISTGGVTVTQATAGNLNATVTGAVSVSTGGVTVTQATASNLNATVTGTVSVSTGGVTAAQGPAGATAWPVSVIEPNVLGATVTYNGQQAVLVATMQVIQNGGGQGTVGWAPTDSSVPVALAGNTATTPIFGYVTNFTTTTPTVLVSSNTSLPAATADAGRVQILGDNQGRIVTMAGVPTAVYQATSPVTAVGGYIVLVASPASTVFTHMIGCIFRNTSATTVAIDIYNSGNAANTGVQDVPIEAVTVDNRGIWTGPEKPFLNTTNGGVQVTAKVSAAASTITGYCQFYQSTSP